MRFHIAICRSLAAICLAAALWPSAKAAPPASASVPPTSTLDWLLAGRLGSEPADAHATIWVSADRSISLNVVADGAFRLGPVLPRANPRSSRTLGLRWSLPSASLQGLGMSAGFESATASCDPGVSWACPLLESEPAPMRRYLAAALYGEGWKLDLAYARYLTPARSGLERPGWHSLATPVGALQGEELTLRGLFGSGWSLGLSVAHWDDVAEPWTDDRLVSPHDSATLSFGVQRGPFTGIVSSRIVHAEIGSGDPQVWGGVDFGLSWRMPWHAELQFGARNLVTRSGAASTSLDANRARTPYVRYHQDF